MARFSNSNNSLYLNVYVDQGSQNISGNSTTVSWRVTVSRTGAYYTYNQTGGSTLTVTIDGEQVHSSNPRWGTSGEEVELARGSRNVSHNSDGSKSVSISANFNPNNGIHGRIVTTGNLGLTTIPRSSSVSVGAGTIGSALAITINRSSSGFTHTLRYAWGSKSGTIATNVGTSYSWTIPMDFCNDVPNATSGQGTIYVDTYNGGTKIGEQAVTLIANVPDSVRPTLSSINLSDGNTAAGQLVSGNTFVQIISNIKVAFSGASGAYGSTITGYRAEIVGRSQATTTNGGSLGIMNYNGQATVRATVTDSRGRTSTAKDVTITILEYFAPYLNFSAMRTGETNSTITLTQNARIAPLTLAGSQKNTLTLSYRTAEQGSSSYTRNTLAVYNGSTQFNSLVNTQNNLNGTFVSNKSYTVIGTLSDKFTSVEFSVTVGTESVVMSYDKDGRVGVGKVVERGKAGSLDVAGDIYAGGKLIQQHALTSGNSVLGYGKSSVNANETYDTGFYWTSVNVPGGDWGCLEVYRFSDKEVQQIFRQRNGSRSWSRYRHYQTGAWTGWVVVGLDQFYPVGSIYQSTNATNPSTFMGGTWTRFGQGRVLVGVSENETEFNVANKVGGSKTHTLTVQEMPSHSHRQRVTANNGSPAIRRDHSSDGNSSIYDQGIDTGSTGGGQAHNNLQPYITVYMWQRTA